MLHSGSVPLCVASSRPLYFLHLPSADCLQMQTIKLGSQHVFFSCHSYMLTCGNHYTYLKRQVNYKKLE